MATQAVSSAFYSLVFLMYVATVTFDWVYIEIGHDLYAGKFKYLTFWNLCLQTVYFAICTAAVFGGGSTSTNVDPRKRSSLEKIRDMLHATLAFPVGMFVVATFWALYAVDRELVYPKALDALIPSWLNHAMFVQATFWALFFLDRDLIYPESRAKLVPPVVHHVCHTTVLPLLLMDKYFVYHHHPRRHNGIFILTFFALSYLAWILWIAYAADLWVYPVLRVMENHERAIFIFFLAMFFISIYLLGEAITKFLWRASSSSIFDVGVLSPNQGLRILDDERKIIAFSDCKEKAALLASTKKKH